MKNIVYVDAEYIMGQEFGRICVVIDNEAEILQIPIQRMPELKQYSNLLEMTAILHALKRSKGITNLRIRSDSQVAVNWANKLINDLDRISLQHFELKQQVDKEKKKFISLSIEKVSRDENQAGFILDEESL